MRNLQIGLMTISGVVTVGLSGCGGGGGSSSSSGTGTIGSGTSATSYTFIQSFGQGQVNQPEGLALDSAGNVYVVDVNNSNSTGSIDKFTSAGVFASSFPSLGSNGSSSSLPIGISVSADNSIHVMASDSDNTEHITTYSGAGQFQSSFGISSRPILGFAQDSTGFSYVQGGTGTTSSVTNQAQGIIAKYDSAGSQVASFGRSVFENINPQNSSPHQPEDIAVASDGTIYADTQIYQGALYKFSASGTLIATYGASGTGTLNGPEGIAVDNIGNVYVMDVGNDRVVKFRADGTYVTSFGSQGTGNGQFRFDALASTPNSADFDNHGIVVAPNGTVYVADAVNQRIEIFAPQ